MTFELAAMLGMGAVLLFGVIALIIAYAVGKDDNLHHASGHHV